MLGVARRRLGSGIVSTARARTTVVVTSPPPSPPVGLTARDPFRSGAGAGPGDADPPLGDGEEGLLRGRQGGESPHPRRRTPTYLPTYPRHVLITRVLLSVPPWACRSICLHHNCFRFRGRGCASRGFALPFSDRRAVGVT
jgi:hypothetical protein